MLFQQLQAVNDAASFLSFTRALADERQRVDDLPVEADGLAGEWANHRIADFLAAGVAWAEDSGFGARPGPAPDNPWSACAWFLWAGRSYE